MTTMSPGSQECMLSLGSDLNKNGSVLCNAGLGHAQLSFPSGLFSGLLDRLLLMVL